VSHAMDLGGRAWEHQSVKTRVGVWIIQAGIRERWLSMELPRIPAGVGNSGGYFRPVRTESLPGASLK
jgi:hypothetical protein